MDCIPRACMGTLGKLYLAMKQVDALPITTEQRVAFLRGDYKLEHTLPDFVEIPQEFQTSLGSLYGIGMIILLYRGEDGQVHADTLPPHMTDRLLMHPAMLRDHAIAGYEQATAD